MAVRNRYVIESVVAFWCCRLVFGIFSLYGGFCHKTESYVSFSLNCNLFANHGAQDLGKQHT